MVLVHEAIFEEKDEELETIVRVTAGRHSVKTDANSHGIFQQALHVLVEKDTEHVVVDLLDGSSRILASLTLDAAEQIFNVREHEPEQMYDMVRRDRRLGSPQLKLTMVVRASHDEEQGLLAQHGLDVNLLVRQQLLKCGEGLSEIEVLKQACSGPLELLQSLGNAAGVWVAVVGPPTSRRWFLGIWRDKQTYDEKKGAVQEIDLLRIQCVQANLSLQHVFEICYYDESRIFQTLRFKRVDRARDVWVEILQMLVQRTHEVRQMQKAEESSRSTKRDKRRSSRKGQSSRDRCASRDRFDDLNQYARKPMRQVS